MMSWELQSYIGVVAKLGKIHKNFEDVERQIKECVKVPRKVNGGKREIVLSEVWVVCTNSITEGAKRKIHAEYPGTNVQFVNGNYLSSMVDRFVPEYWSNVELPLSTYLGSLKSRTEELDKSLDLIQLEGSPVYIEQDVLRVETDPYQAGDGKKRNRATRVNFIEELNKNQVILMESAMGGGKSKLLRRLTQHYADIAVFSNERTLPVYATFRELIEEHKGDLRELLAHKVPQATLDCTSEDDEYLFLIDAVDEKNMPPEELSDQMNSILDTINNDKKFRLVLTSRYIGSLEFDKRFVHRMARYEIAELTICKIISYLLTISKG